MDSFRELVAVALAELRSSRRLVRTWMFIALSALACMGLYVYYTGLHGFLSSQSATIGLLNARFLMSAQSVVLTAIFMVAIVFLAFDVRTRDTQARMAEVLDSRPIGNATLLVGRLLGLVLIAWLPLAVVLLLIQGVGAAALFFDWPMGEPIQPTSVLALLLVDAPFTLALWCAIVIFLTTVLRNRLVVAVAALALLGSVVWGFFQLPLYLVAPVVGMTTTVHIASDLLPRFLDSTIFVNRAATVSLTAGLLLVAALLYPRADQGSRMTRLGAAAGFLLLGAIGIAVLVAQARGETAQRAHWLAVHQARQEQPRVLVDRVGGRVAIAPGEELRLELDYQLSAPAGYSFDELVFAFNPAMTVEELHVAGEARPFTHEDGLLIVAAQLAAGSGVELRIVASGVPDSAFAYLDSALDPRLLSGQDAQLTLLGTEASIFDDDYVALMPAVAWLPMPGVAVGREDPTSHGSDYFAVDLSVQVPEHWLVAGPGRRRADGDAEGRAAGRFRFRADVVPEVALLASAFESRALDVGGVQLELLVSHKHQRNVALFAEAADVIAERAGDLFDEAAKLGLSYPYDALTLVEAPAALRSYGGGWRMASVQFPPAVVILREYGFPTARFDFRFRDPEEIENAEGGPPAVKAEVLGEFFQNDFAGGNPWHGALRNVFAFQTGAVGEGAVALDFLAHELAAQLITQRRSGYFSAHALGDSETFQTVLTQTFLGFGEGGLAESVYRAGTNRPQVWDRALGASLVDLQPQTDPLVALNVLWLKVPNVAAAIIDALGREGSAAFLAELRRRHVGGNFTDVDFAAVAADVGANLNSVLGDWLHDAALPGFLTSEAAIFRIADDDQGQPRYQISVHVRNDEPVPGLVRLSYEQYRGEQRIADQTVPVRIGAETSVELGLVAPNPPEQVRVAPYLSLNRRSLALTLPSVDAGATVDAEAFSGWRVSDWQPAPDDGIVIDDLDLGFTIRDVGEASSDAEGDGGSAVPGNVADVDIDQGLPVYPLATAEQWARQETPSGWGKYRHTIARTSPGGGETQAVFTASLPVAGRWRVEFHMPDLRTAAARAARAGAFVVNVSDRLGNDQLGSYDMQLLADGETTPVEFDGAASEVGWNGLGEFELPAGEVSLRVSNETSGALVVVDAVRWRRAEAS